VPIHEKHDRTVSLHWTGGGPLQSIYAEVRPASPPDSGVLVRGNIKVPDGRLWGADKPAAVATPKLGKAIAPGFLRILRQAHNASVSHGEVEIQSGELDDDVEHLFGVSEQVPTRVKVVVVLDGEGRVQRARGALVQALPGADPARLDALTLTLGADDTPEQVLARALGADAQILEKLPARFACPCSKERALAGIALLDRDEIIDMIVREHGAEVRCQMCGTLYKFTQEDLLPLIETRDPAGPGEA
jgi:redox-regulated HSP33 family molecular chaperone